MARARKVFSRIARLVIVALISTFLVSVVPQTAIAQPVLLVTDAFTGPDNGVAQAIARGWSVGGSGDQCFGSTGNHTEMVDSTDSGGPVDRLRLVYNDENCESGYALYNVEQSAVAGLDIVFNMAMSGAGGGHCPNQPEDNYNTLSGGQEFENGERGNEQSDCQADGIVFYLKDGRNQSEGEDSLGRAGGSLGYSAQGNGVGLDGGLIGIGFDAYGNYYQNPFGGQDCYLDPVYEDPTYVTPARRSLLFRGAEGVDESGNSSRHFGYCRIPTPDDRYVSDETGERNIGIRLPDELFTVQGQKIRITVDTSDFTMGNNGTLKVYVTSTGTTDWENIEPITQIEIPQELRDAQTFKFGFVAGTGGGTMNGDIWGVSVNSLRSVPMLRWKTPATDFCTVANQYFYAKLDGQYGVRPYSFELSGSLPAGISFNAESGELTGANLEPVGTTTSFQVEITDSSTEQPRFTQTFSILSAATCEQGLSITDHEIVDVLAPDGNRLIGLAHSDFQVYGYDPQWRQRWYRCDSAPTVDTSQVIQDIDPSCIFTGVEGAYYIPTESDLGKYIGFAVTATDLDETPYVINTPEPNTYYQVDVYDYTTYSSRTIFLTSDSNSQIQVSLTREEMLSGHDFEFDLFTTSPSSNPQITIESVVPADVMGTVDDYYSLPQSWASWKVKITNLDTSEVIESAFDYYSYEYPDAFTLDDLFNHWWRYFSPNPNFVASDHFKIEFFFDYMFGSGFTPELLRASTVRYSDHVITTTDLAPYIGLADSLNIEDSETQTWSAPLYTILNNPTQTIQTWYLCDSVPIDKGFQAPQILDPVESAKPNDCVEIIGATGNEWTASESDVGKYLVLGITAVNQYGSWTVFPESDAIEFSNVIDPSDPPVIHSVTPQTAVAGTTITITGTGFSVNAEVKLDDIACDNLIVVSDSEIICDLPMNLSGDVNLVVINPDSQEDSVGFTYLEPYVPGTLTVSGSNSVGSTLVVELQGWPSNSQFSYQWYCNGVAIDNASEAQYEIQSSDSGCRITVSVIGTKSGFTQESVLSTDIQVPGVLHYRQVSKIFTGFAYLRYNLTSKMKRQMASWLNKYPTSTDISCLGVTGLNWEHKTANYIKKVGKLRAQVSCNYLKSKKPSLKIRKLKNKATNHWWPSIRSVRITIKYRVG